MGLLTTSLNDMCVHYWIIDSHNDGYCKRCNATKTFLRTPLKYNKVWPLDFATKTTQDEMTVLEHEELPIVVE